MSVNALLEEFKVKAATPKQQLAEYKAPTLRPSAVQKSTVLLSTAPSLS